MGIGGISPVSLVIILVIVLLLFGTKKLRGLGSDLGGAIKGFKDSMSGEDKKPSEKSADSIADTETTAEKNTAETEKSSS